jgi:hypothetical protein
MSNAWSEPACCERQRISISSLTDMSYEGDEAVPPHSLDELIGAAYDCLEQNRVSGMSDALKRILVEKAVQQDNSSRLQAHVARFIKAIQAHDARLLTASAAALAAVSDGSITVFPTSDTLARNAMNIRRHYHSTVPLAKPRRCAMNMGPLRCSDPLLLPPSEFSPPEEHPLYPTLDTLARNAPASRNEHTAALPLYVGTDRVSTQRRGRPRKKESPR